MLSEILKEITSSPTFKELVISIKNQRCPSDCLKMQRAVRLPFLAALHKTLNQPILLITDRTDRALTLLDELKLWTPSSNRFLFPEPSPLFYDNSPWGITTRHERLLALTSLASQLIPGAPGRDQIPIMIAPVRAIMTRTIPRREFIKSSYLLNVGQQVVLDQLARKFVKLGYESSNLVIAAGQFARRGGILDIWPHACEFPSRIEFFGDEIDTIREFDPASQLTIRAIEKILVTPAREFILDEKISETIEGEISEFHIPLLYSTETSILDYLPQNALVLIDDTDAFEDMINNIEEQAIRLRRENIEEGLLPPDFPLAYITWDQIQDSIPRERTILLGPSGTQDTEPRTKQLSSLFSPNPRFGGQVKPFLEYLKSINNSPNKVFIISRQSARLSELWHENRPLGLEEEPHFIQGSLTEGWKLSLEDGKQIHLLTDGEIFGWRRPIPRKRHRPIAESPESVYADLKQGDWVVHIDHGIGKFLGLVRREIEGSEREYLCIEYADGDQLFVPVHQADRLNRYVGSDSRPPRPSRLGGAEWQNIKSRVKEAVENIAEDLLTLYAKRNIGDGHAFNKDTPWQYELEASFPYIETEDQIRVIQEVKRDMEASRPMDRLICGDVGYGKTEIALRAAFKAVMDGKQVALLVPTTVLAQQHYQTFQERLSPFPIEVEMLSRFRTTQQQNAIIEKLAKGTIDIIIGTHRLLSQDVHIKNLGLLIIDEEQRFGVTHKEQLKNIRTELDVLTMTATPIPRTLYMTLTGIRDISTINTPPEERLPIITHVGPYDPKIVRKAILREIERGGQVFFVHNRVQTIQGMMAHLQKIVPEARISIAHGQMMEKELSKHMKEFSFGKIDVLLSTSIIESGLDIPNANTLIIDRADTFGLSQLYQLRGRVGRGAQRAYAYFFRHPRRSPTPEGRERLETIAENSQLGAGFSIAMRDLEIRGAGDILGTRQHGHIAAVGFHLYTRLLSEAISKLQDKQKSNVDIKSPFRLYRSMVSVDLPFNVNIPKSYVSNRETRLSLYRRIANIHSLEEINILKSEFSDRFGEVPKPVLNLLYQIKIKYLAEQANLISVTSENGKIILRYQEDMATPTWIETQPGIRTGKHTIWLTIADLPHPWKQSLLEILTKLSSSPKY